MRALMVGLAVAAVLGTPAQATPTNDPDVRVSSYGGDAIFPTGLPAAPTEDACYSYRCVWDARHQGNGTGQSLILTQYRGGFLMKPITHGRAHWLQAQYCDRPNVTCESYGDY